MINKTAAAAILAAGLVVGCGSSDHGTDRSQDLAPTTTVERAMPCQEDELMVWVEVPHTAECVNEVEYAEQLHEAAGHTG
jgi:hypothetical protein